MTSCFINLEIVRFSPSSTPGSGKLRWAVAMGVLLTSIPHQPAQCFTYGSDSEGLMNG